MLKKYSPDSYGKSNHGWLDSLFHFSFDEYYNPDRNHFGSLRVLNDDLLAATNGFELHPHRDMEIISYVVAGELTHGDSMGNNNTISRGQVQYMSAGTGILHSEHNLGIETLRLIQLWITPNQKGLAPYYGDYRFDPKQRENQFLHMVSPKGGTAPIQINADANVYAIELAAGLVKEFPVEAGRQVYLVQLEGSSSINTMTMNARDAAESVEESLVISAIETSHLLIVELRKG